MGQDRFHPGYMLLVDHVCVFSAAWSMNRVACTIAIFDCFRRLSIHGHLWAQDPSPHALSACTDEGLLYLLKSDHLGHLLHVLSSPNAAARTLTLEVLCRMATLGVLERVGNVSVL